jgi:hypothetical protein
MLSDNTTNSEYIIPTRLDIVLEKVEKISDDPEVLGDKI